MRKLFLNLIFFFLTVFAHSATVFAQGARLEIKQQREAEGISMWWYVLIFMMTAGLLAVIFELFKRKAAQKKAEARASKRRSFENREMNSIDADREIRWANKTSKLPSRKIRKRGTVEKVSKNLPAAYELPDIDANLQGFETPENNSREAAAALPVFNINRIELARPFLPLPVSNDEFLLDAIEQVNEEFEEDEQAREIALRVLAAFKTQNSVEAIEQIALYDFSSNLRSRAVGILADFDHESVFEAILLACADPSREVRAAAARGLFHLSFERKEAWERITGLAHHGRIRQCARALIAGDLVERSLERLVHPDRNYAAEAFALTALLIKADETDEVFKLFKNHSDPNIKKAILHVIKITDDANALEKLAAAYDTSKFSAEICRQIEDILENSTVAVLCV